MLPIRNAASPKKAQMPQALMTNLPRLALAACLVLVSYCLWAFMGGGGGSSIAHGPDRPNTFGLSSWLGSESGEGMRAARTMLRGVGQQSNPKSPLTTAGYTLYSKLRQELYCRDSANQDKPKEKVTHLGDAMNTVMIEINPLPAYITVYGGAQDIVSQAFLAGGQWEGHDLAEIMWGLRTALPKDALPTSATTPGLFVDVGANIGAFIFNVAAAGFEVIAFEGMLANQRLLRNSLCASHPLIMARTTLHAFGLGAVRETCYLLADDGNRGDGIPQCGAHNDTHALQLYNDPRYFLRGTMDVERMDDVIQSDIKVMKIDVEGFEPNVLEGAMKLFTEHTVWFVVMEYNKPLLDMSRKGKTTGKRVDFVLDLFKMGYRISLSSFQGPYLSTLEEVINMDTQHEPQNTNIYLIHKRYHQAAPKLRVI